MGLEFYSVHDRIESPEQTFLLAEKLREGILFYANPRAAP